MLGESDALRALYEGLHGSVLTRAQVGPGEIIVDFAGPDGTLSLSTAGSTWCLVRGDDPVVTYQDDENAIDRFEIATGKRVVGVDPRAGGGGLRIDLGDSLALFVIQSDDDIAPDLPVLEALTPDRRMIVLHRDGLVDDVPSDVPIRELIASGALRHWPSDNS